MDQYVLFTGVKGLNFRAQMLEELLARLEAHFQLIIENGKYSRSHPKKRQENEVVNYRTKVFHL
jgi:23S rRNA maturation mini-RNase III